MGIRRLFTSLSKLIIDSFFIWCLEIVILKQIPTSCSKMFLVVVVVVLYVLVLLIQPKRFHMWYPTIPIYPDNNKEIDFMVKEYISKRTQNHIAFFHLTDATPLDGFVKSRHSRVGGNPESAKLLKRLDSRFHGNDENEDFQTFYESIIFDGFVKSSRCKARKN